MDKNSSNNNREITTFAGALLFLAAVIILTIVLDLPKIVSDADKILYSSGSKAVTSFPPNMFKSDDAYANSVTIEPVETPINIITPTPTSTNNSREIIAPYSVIDIGHEHILAIKNDGTVYASGNNENGRCNVSSWDDIVEVAAGYTFSIGLRKDGHVLFAGKDNFNRVSAERVESWKNIKRIAAHGSGVIAIDTQGKIFVDGGSSETGKKYSLPESVENRTDAVAIAAGNQHLMVLFSDGSVAAFGDTSGGMCEVQNWRGIVAIAAGAGGSVGVTASGDVLYTGVDNHNQGSYAKLHDVVAVSTKGWHMLYLQKDGSIGAVGWEANERCNISAWNNGRTVVAIGTSAWNSVAVFSDGTISLIGHQNLISQTDVSKWKSVTTKVTD